VVCQETEADPCTHDCDCCVSPLILRTLSRKGWAKNAVTPKSYEWLLADANGGLPKANANWGLKSAGCGGLWVLTSTLMGGPKTRYNQNPMRARLRVIGIDVCLPLLPKACDWHLFFSAP
jgi:hypothetical protein